MDYRHQTRAGNFADVHKHWLLSLLLHYNTQKQPRLHYIESHAGSGCYALASSTAHHNGIQHLRRSSTAWPDSLRSYLTAAGQNGRPTQPNSRYRGSPLIAGHFLRRQDRATLFESGPVAFQELESALGAEQRFTLKLGDGFQGVSTLALPENEQPLLLVDPPYTDLEEFTQVERLAQRMTERKPDIQIAIWCPLFTDRRERSAHESLRVHLGERLWECELRISGRREHTMQGCSMLLLNSPAPVVERAESDGPHIARMLGGEMCYWRPS